MANCCEGNFCEGLVTNKYLNDVINAISISASSSADFVDLGLTSGTLWGKKNIGASVETDYGNYYQYGRGSKTYQETSAITTPYEGLENPLNASADTASEVLGTQYSMPTEAQLLELNNEATKEWINNYEGSGKNGMKYSGNGNYIFIPANGEYSNGTISSLNYSTNIWSSTPSGGDTQRAIRMRRAFRDYEVDYTYRDSGLGVRPVSDLVNVCIQIPSAPQYEGCCGNASGDEYTLLKDNFDGLEAVIANTPSNDISGYIINNTPVSINACCSDSPIPSSSQCITRGEVTLFFSLAHSVNITLTDPPTYCKDNYTVEVSKGYIRYSGVCSSDGIEVIPSEEIFENETIPGRISPERSYNGEDFEWVSGGTTMNSGYTYSYIRRDDVKFSSSTEDNCHNVKRNDIIVASKTYSEYTFKFSGGTAENTIPCEGGDIYLNLTNFTFFDEIVTSISATVDGSSSEIAVSEQVSGNRIYEITLPQNDSQKDFSVVEVTVKDCTNSGSTIIIKVPREKCEVPLVSDECQIFWNIEDNWKDIDGVSEYTYDGEEIGIE